LGCGATPGSPLSPFPGETQNGVAELRYTFGQLIQLGLGADQEVGGNDDWEPVIANAL
jgi:hypothetical protein